jgi:uncharacterized protein
MENQKQFFQSMAVLGLLLALGMSMAAFILGVQAKKAASGQQNITVKGLAVKEVKADSVEWTITLSLNQPTFAEALARLRTERPVVEAFLIKERLDNATRQIGNESVTAHMETVYLPQGGNKTEQRGYDASQSIVVTTKALDKIASASKNLLTLQSEGHPVTAASPQYLVGNLEDIKMSLIAAATQNARKRAEEFVKQDHLQVGPMRSASQGAFYILAPGGENDNDDYGGTYDKTTVNKIAKVVVTIVYSIAQ